MVASKPGPAETRCEPNYFRVELMGIEPTASRVRSEGEEEQEATKRVVLQCSSEAPRCRDWFRFDAERFALDELVEQHLAALITQACEADPDGVGLSRYVGA